MKPLPKQWAPVLLKQGETGMGYQVATVRLRDGASYPQVVIDSGFVTRVRGFASVPFDPADIVDIQVTHDKWDWHENAA
jgi:hypothetical protein